MNKLLSKKHLVSQQMFFIVIFFLFFTNISFSEEYTSSDFKIIDPSAEYGGGYSTSTNYTLNSSLNHINSSTSSATSYNLSPDFLYYPTITIPVVSPTAGNGEVALSWTASVGELGWNVTGYNVGVSTVSGGPYTFSSSLGNVLSSTRTGLTNGTLYYFVIRVEDAFGNIVATSSQVSATPAAPVVPPSGGGGGGGGGWLPPLIIPPVIPQATTTVATSSQTTTAVISGYSFTRDLTIGNTGNDVVVFQQFLVNSGFLVMPAGVTYGTFGNLTKSALSKYQIANGITPAVGYFGSKTRSVLNAIINNVITTPPVKQICKAYITKSIKLGAVNDPIEVKKLQTFLKDYEGFSTLSITGFYGQSSYDAVKKFQAKYAKDILIPAGITSPTGYVLTSTINKINDIYCKNTSQTVVAPIVPVTSPVKPICKAYITKSIKLGAVNDPAEVKKLQTFLKDYEGFSTLSITGFYGQSSYDAVKKFQAKYAKDILIPVGITSPTGYVLTSTINKINDIYCKNN